MKEALRISTLCLVIALGLNVAFSQAQLWLIPYPPIPTASAHPADAATAMEEIPWLQINTVNARGRPRNQPEQTQIFTTAKPAIRQIGKNRWQITFTSTN